MDLKQLQFFVVSVDCGSLKKASELLYISQPHISKTIRALEAELQVELLKRRSRGVEVTDAGRKVYEYAYRILVESGKIQSIRDNEAFHTLSIATNSNSRLAKLFQLFYTEERKCQIHAQYLECGMEEIFQHIHRHAAEIGFVHVDPGQMTAFEQKLKYRHLDFTFIGKAALCLFVGPKSPVYDAEFVTGKDLKELQYVQMKDEQDYLGMNLIKGAEDYRYYRSRGQLLVTSSRQMLMDLLSTTCLGSIGCGLTAAAQEEGVIRGIPIKGRHENMIFGYVKRIRDGVSSEAAAFAEYVKKHWND